MTHEQRIAEIREALELGKKWTISATVFTDAKQIDTAITSLDTLAEECLRLREDKKRLDWLETGESKDDPIEWPSGRVTRKAIDLCRQSLDAAKEVR